MRTQEIKFAVRTCNGVVSAVGQSFILQPKVQYRGGGMKWYQDKHKAAGSVAARG